MVTTTVGMVDGVHGDTTSLWPGVALDCELMLCTRCLCMFVSTQLTRSLTENVYSLSSGLSVRPPPATIPIIPLAVL